MADHWYKNAIIYALDLHRFMDGDGDGCGDFEGLTQKLGYLSDLGVTCLWLLPFYPSPQQDNGYDVSDYRHIDRQVGSFEDFDRFLQAAGEHSLRVIVDLVVDHTSKEHPWFQAARRSQDSRYRDYYVWSEHPPPVPSGKGPMFPGEQESVWTYDEKAGQYYSHRFYAFEPDLNTSNPEVQEEIRRIIDFWLSFGVSGFRVDAANHLIEPSLSSPDEEPAHSILEKIRATTQAHNPEAVLLGEADEPPEELAEYFGDDDQLHMLFNFVLNNYLFLGLAREEAGPIAHALRRLPRPPAGGQWANFLRNLDELDLERLPDEDQKEVIEQFAPDDEMRIYGRGIRRRLAPMLEGNPRRLKMAFSLLFSLPGAPVIVYGDEIGMGEDLSQPGRDAVRAPMQWSPEKNAGFSSAREEELLQPVIRDGPFGVEEVNVRDQEKDPDSLLNWMKQAIHLRRRCPEIGEGNLKLFDVQTPEVLAHRCVWKDTTFVAVHNMSGDEQEVTLDLRDQRGRTLKKLFGEPMEEVSLTGDVDVTLEPYGFRWYRIRNHE